MAKKRVAPINLDGPGSKEESPEIVTRDELLSGAATNQLNKPRLEDRLERKRVNLPVSIKKLVETAGKDRGIRHFTPMLKEIFNEYLLAPDDFKLVELDDNDGEKKLTDLRLPIGMIDKIQARANKVYGGNFSGLAQEILKGWLVKHKYL